MKAVNFEEIEIGNKILVDLKDRSGDHNHTTPEAIGIDKEKFCRECKYDKAETYHDKMWCRDCRQKDRFTQRTE